jgi:hypothetical protein
MTPDRVCALVDRWVRFYTRDLPAPVAERRAGEIAADLHDHIAHERAAGTSERRIARGIASRMLRGVAADASWRHRTRTRPSGHEDRSMMRRTLSRPGVRPALVTACILLVPLLTTLFSDAAAWSLGDFVLAAAVLGGTGLLLELLVKNPRNLAYRTAAVALGVVAMLFGNADDAPGLVLFGLLLIGATVALALRTAQRGE